MYKGASVSFDHSFHHRNFQRQGNYYLVDFLLWFPRWSNYWGLSFWYMVSDKWHSDNGPNIWQSITELTLPNSDYPVHCLGSTVFASGKPIMLFHAFRLYWWPWSAQVHWHAAVGSARTWPLTSITAAHVATWCVGTLPIPTGGNISDGNSVPLARHARMVNVFAHPISSRFAMVNV